jgi:hypothetical protein
MMQLAEEHCAANAARGLAPTVELVVRAANFQRVYQSLQLLPDAVALRLFDDALLSDPQQFVQVLVPFLLRHLSRELDKENSASSGGALSRTSNSSKVKNTGAPITVGGIPSSSAVDDLFGFSTHSSTTFLHSGVHKVDPTVNRAHALELVYPSLSTPATGSAACGGGGGGAGGSSSRRGAGAAKQAAQAPMQSSSLALAHGASISQYKVTGKRGRAGVSFAAVLWSSFQKEVSMKGWCAESDSFEPFRKNQSIVSLPKMLSLLCGNTQCDVKDSTTLAGALGETLGHGSTHANFWSNPVLVTNELHPSRGAPVSSGGSPCDAGGTLLPRETPARSLIGDGASREYSWLPLELEIIFRKEGDKGSSESGPSSSSPPSMQGSPLIVSCRCVPFTSNCVDVQDEGDSSDASAQGSIWIIFDGTTECVSATSASKGPGFDWLLDAESGADWSVASFQLSGLVLQVSNAAMPSEKKHLVIQLNKGKVNRLSNWHLFNDFVVQPINVANVVSFPKWKHPCIVTFEQQLLTAAATIPTDKLIVPSSVLQLESLSRTPSIRLLQSFASLPGPGDLIAFDGEFVSVSLEKSMINAAGERVVSEEVRQVLARISLLDMGHGPKDAATSSFSVTEGPGASVFNKNMMRIIADDYILPLEPVLDYVTRFSGITEEDLNHLSSKHSILTQRAAYLKLRYFIDAKCVFVGHGLQKDFETANIFIPPEQVYYAVASILLETS